MSDPESEETDVDKFETISEQELFELRQAFSSVDQDNDGLIDFKAIPSMFKRLDKSFEHFFIEQDELRRLIDQNHITDSDQITFTQFLTVIACKRNVKDTIEELQEAFSIFDRANSGFITTKELLRVMQRLGENISETEAEEMMREADRDLDGKISFTEFIEMIRHS